MKRQKIISEVTNFLKDRNPDITNQENQTFFEIGNKNNNQIVIIQITKECEIWVRLIEPNSGYLCESIEEFKNYFHQLINNKIEVAIGYKNSIWKESVIVNLNQYSNLNSDYNYTIASWLDRE